ncbi:hypothetical protein SAMN05216223_11791 [Actinacidiphila yanglinensis]|uniref:Uncharacterized protein n=1 Tax=Actinacidiphila yanglinensis TaxID=310779 RepID=A0A1H6DPE7_9ACTN|nr:hypothetical protein [Actinacidiphila yanglinensis]SEG86425.1 hypothetical protein SAMN05216223_11791 [Actinacidiphila yanglinensis]
MTIVIALAVIAVVAVGGVWLLRKQASEQREGEPRPLVEDGPPPSAEDRDAPHPAPDRPWRDDPLDRPGDDGLRSHDLPHSADPDVVPATPVHAAPEQERQA